MIFGIYLITCYSTFHRSSYSSIPTKTARDASDSYSILVLVLQAIIIKLILNVERFTITGILTTVVVVFSHPC